MSFVSELHEWKLCLFATKFEIFDSRKPIQTQSDGSEKKVVQINAEVCTSKVRKCQEIDVKFEDHVMKVLYMMARCYESWILPISECIASLSKDE